MLISPPAQGPWAPLAGIPWLSTLETQGRPEGTLPGVWTFSFEGGNRSKGRAALRSGDSDIYMFEKWENERASIFTRVNGYIESAILQVCTRFPEVDASDVVFQTGGVVYGMFKKRAASLYT